MEEEEDSRGPEKCIKTRCEGKFGRNYVIGKVKVEVETSVEDASPIVGKIYRFNPMVLELFAMRKIRQYNNDVDDDTDVVYKDVVIVGNGPGAICLSYMLAGNWPYYTGEPHPGDEMLTARLNYVTRNSRFEPELNNENVKNVYENKARRCKITNKSHGACLARTSRSSLATLVSGVEGRGGGKPLALLMDQLQHPCVDIGLDLPSLIDWLPEHKIIDHVVLGKGPPGGSWQSMDPDVLTISLNRWMSLPSLHIKKWCKIPEEMRDSVIMTDRLSNGRHKRDKATACKAGSRIPVGTVAAYYEDYVRFQGLEKYFKCGRTVTSVRPVQGLRNNEDEYGWIVRGYENVSGKRFVYRCKRVVLATGTMDSPNRLDLPGEESQPDWITHDLNDLENKLDRLASENINCSMIEKMENSSSVSVEPILVVGAGLSAADAIMAARFHGIPVIHAFRDSTGDWSRKRDSNDSGLKLGTSNYDRLQWLPASIYPEYHKVYEMMANGGTNYPLYKALPGYSVVDLGSNGSENFGAQRERRVTLCSPNGQLQNFRVSAVAILIGSRPDLSYLGEYATRLGKIVNKPIDSKSNPIETDNFTYEVLRSPRKGLYALGPIVGDNFVRFLLGGAFGILANILNTTET